MSRKLARENIIKLLFSIGFQKDCDIDEVIQKAISDAKESEKDEELMIDRVNENDIDFIKENLSGILLNLDNIDKTINQYSIRWKTERMPRVDLAILRNAIYEILFLDNIPDSVSINEAVELAKKYSTEDSGSFINGILGNVLKNKL